MSDIPTTEPASIRAGDTWRWTRDLPDYPAGTWTLKYRFKTNAGATGFEITAGASGTLHSINVAAATTAAYTAGDYTWTAWVEGGSSEKYTVAEGSTAVQPDYRTASAATLLDDRSHAKKMLDSIEAWLESRDPAVAEYEIAGRRMKYVPITELIRLRNHYQTQVDAEAQLKKLAQGIGSGARRIQFRV
jgi:membrane-bound inhibitor of C-type lysozyme